MKRSIIYTLVMAMVMMCTLNASADDKKRDGGKPNVTPEMRAQRNAERMAQQLKLDDATTSKFIETYKAYEAEKGKVYKKYMGERKAAPAEGEKPQRKTDAEIEKEILNKMAMGRAIIDVRESYYKKFRKFLNPRQIQYIFSQERDNAHHMKQEKDRRDHMKKGKEAREKGKEARQKAKEARDKAKENA